MSRSRTTVLVLSDNPHQDAQMIAWALSLVDRQLRRDGSRLREGLRSASVLPVSRPEHDSTGPDATFQRHHTDVADADPVSLLLTYEEAGARLGGVSARTVQRLVARGDLPASSIGRRRFIDPDVLAEYAANRKSA